MPYDPPIEPPAPTVREFEDAIREISDALGCGCTVYDCKRAAAALRAEVERLAADNDALTRDRNGWGDTAQEYKVARDDAQARLAALVSRLRGLFGVEKPFHIDGCRCVRCDVHDALAAAQSGDGRKATAPTDATLRDDFCAKALRWHRLCGDASRDVINRAWLDALDVLRAPRRRRIRAGTRRWAVGMWG